MFCRLFLRSYSIKGCSISQGQVGSRLSPTTLSFKPTLTRALHLARNLRIFTTSKIQLSTLRSGVCRQNGKILAEKRSSALTSIKRMHSADLNVNTDVTNNVYLYKYNRPKFFYFLKASAVIQLVVWLGIAYVSYSHIPNRKPDQTSFKEYIFNNWFGIFALVMATITGVGGAFCLWIFSARSVRYLILNKGGKSVTFVTYHALNEKRIITVPLERVKCSRSRQDRKSSYIPIKIIGRGFYYLLDAEGDYTNPTLFDYTVGSERS